MGARTCLQRPVADHGDRHDERGGQRHRNTDVHPHERDADQGTQEKDEHDNDAPVPDPGPGPDEGVTDPGDQRQRDHYGVHLGNGHPPSDHGLRTHHQCGGRRHRHLHVESNRSWVIASSPARPARTTALTTRIAVIVETQSRPGCPRSSMPATVAPRLKVTRAASGPTIGRSPPPPSAMPRMRMLPVAVPPKTWSKPTNPTPSTIPVTKVSVVSRYIRRRSSPAIGTVIDMRSLSSAGRWPARCWRTVRRAGRSPSDRGGMSRCPQPRTCLLYTSDAADEEDSVDLGGRRI